MVRHFAAMTAVRKLIDQTQKQLNSFSNSFPPLETYKAVLRTGQKSFRLTSEKFSLRFRKGKQFFSNGPFSRYENRTLNPGSKSSKIHYFQKYFCSNMHFPKMFLWTLRMQPWQACWKKNCPKYNSFVAQNPEKRLILSGFSMNVFKTFIWTRTKRF